MTALAHPARTRSTPVLFALLLGLGLACASQSAPPAQPPALACTTEAKMCPDGSGVGRTGPNCEFAPCPDAGPDAGPDAPDAGPDAPAPAP